MSIASEISRISQNVSDALTAISNKGVTVPSGSNSDDLATLIAQISGGGTPAISVVDTADSHGGVVRTVTALDISDSTAVAADVLNSKWFYTAQGVKTQGTATGGGGGGMSTQTGTFTGSGGITAQISCNSAPDEIYIYGDLSGDPSLRGVISLTLLKDVALFLTSDTSQSSAQEAMIVAVHGISGYNENNQSSEPYASYANGVLTLDMGENTSSKRFASGITYSYKLISYSGATQHTIHLEFSDATDTDIEVDYDNALIGTMITAYTPSGWTYNNKTVTLAQLDGVTWYQSAVIPIGVELIDYTAVTADTAIGSDGAAMSQQWYYASDYTAVDSSMTFSYTAGLWFYIGVYDNSYNVVRTIYVYSDGTVDPDDSNTGHGTLSGSKLTGASYVRLCGTWYDSDHMSLVRTA